MSVFSRMPTSAITLGKKILAQRHMLVTAESCTGGALSAAVTSVSGSSQWFDRGFITYSNEAKIEMLGVDSKTLETHGAVSENTASEMALGALQNSRADIAISITGIAGPDGGTQQKPVGTVCFGWGFRDDIQTCIQHFSGDRTSIRAQAVEFALGVIISLANSTNL